MLRRLISMMRVIAVTPSAITNTANGAVAVTQTVFTFSAQSIGTEDATRQVVVCVAGQRLSSPSAVSSLTVGGVSATRIANQQTGNANDHTCEIWAASVPTGTTADVVVTFNADHLRCSYSVYRMVNAGASASDTAIATNSSAAVAASIDVPANGCAVAAVYDNGNTSYTWTNLTERYEFGSADRNTFSSASDDFATTQTGLSITATQASNQPPQALVIASWAPA